MGKRKGTTTNFFAELRDGFRSKVTGFGKKDINFRQNVRPGLIPKPSMLKCRLKVFRLTLTSFVSVLLLGRLASRISIRECFSRTLVGWMVAVRQRQEVPGRWIRNSHNFRGRKAHSLFLVHADVRIFCSFCGMKKNLAVWWNNFLPTDDVRTQLIKRRIDPNMTHSPSAWSRGTTSPIRKESITNKWNERRLFVDSNIVC